MLSPTTPPPTNTRAESLVLLTHSVGQTSVSATQWPESNKITFTATFLRPSELYPLSSVILIWNMILNWNIFYSPSMMYMKLWITRCRVSGIIVQFIEQSHQGCWEDIISSELDRTLRRLANPSPRKSGLFLIAHSPPRLESSFDVA